MSDPTYRTSVGCDGDRYIHFFGAPLRRVAICLDPEGGAHLMFDDANDVPRGVDLPPEEARFCTQLWEALIRMGGPTFVDGPASPRQGDD